MYNKLIRNRVLIAISCLVISGIITFKVIPNYAISDKELVSVLIAKENIQVGDQLVVGQNIELRGFNPSNVPKSTPSMKEINSKVFANREIEKNDFILSNKFSNKNPNLIELQENDVIVSVAFDGLAESVASKVRKNDRVSVTSYKKNEKTVNLEDELSDLLVLDVVNSVGKSINSDSDMLDDSRIEKADAIVFSCSLEQAIKLISLEKTSDLHFILTDKKSSLR
jgi:hypothetical protein